MDQEAADIDADDLQQRTDMLNEEQQSILDRLLFAVRDDTSRQKLFFIDAPGGTGELHCRVTFLTKEVQCNVCK